MASKLDRGQIQFEPSQWFIQVSEFRRVCDLYMLVKVSKYPNAIALYARLYGLWLLASQSLRGPGLMSASGQSSPSPTYFSPN